MQETFPASLAPTLFMLVPERAPLKSAPFHPMSREE